MESSPSIKEVVVAEVVPVTLLDRPRSEEVIRPAILIEQFFKRTESSKVVDESTQPSPIEA